MGMQGKGSSPTGSSEKKKEEVPFTYWEFNVMMNTCRVPSSLIYYLCFGLQKSLDHGFFHGYSPAVWVAFCTNIVFGFAVGLVIKLLNVISKSLGVTCALVFTYIFQVSLGTIEFDSVQCIAIASTGVLVFMYQQTK